MFLLLQKQEDTDSVKGNLDINRANEGEERLSVSLLYRQMSPAASTKVHYSWTWALFDPPPLLALLHSIRCHSHRKELNSLSLTLDLFSLVECANTQHLLLKQLLSLNTSNPINNNETLPSRFSSPYLTFNSKIILLLSTVLPFLNTLLHISLFYISLSIFLIFLLPSSPRITFFFNLGLNISLSSISDKHL